MKTTLPCFSSVLCMLTALVLAGRGYADNAQEIIGRWECVESRIGTTTFTTAQGEENLKADFAPTARLPKAAGLAPTGVSTTPFFD